MIDLTMNRDNLKRSVERAREKGIIIPTFAQMRNPALIPEKIKEKLKNVGLWDVNTLNLFRVSWHNEPKDFGGTFGGVNFIEFPSELTGVKARIIMLTGKWFPTGCHKVGASFGCLVPRLVTGQFTRPTTRQFGRAPQLLPRRRVKLRASGLPVHRHSARRDEQRAFRLAQDRGGRNHRHAGLRIER
jgi:hypothetical protein